MGKSWVPESNKCKQAWSKEEKIESLRYMKAEKEKEKNASIAQSVNFARSKEQD